MTALDSRGADGGGGGGGGGVRDNGPLVLSQHDDRVYRHITMPNQMQASQGKHNTCSQLKCRNVFAADSFDYNDVSHRGPNIPRATDMYLLLISHRL